MTTPSLPGIHHVTAITGDAQANVDFYCGTLGLRLVKRTVNFDDPRSYHLYYGDGLGRPGTIMTFFAWPGARPGRVGPAQVTATAFLVGSGSLEFWRDRLADSRVEQEPIIERMGERVLSCSDPDDIRIELIEQTAPDGFPWEFPSIPLEHRIHGFHSVSLAEEGHETTARLLTGMMGYELAGTEGNRFRYRASGNVAVGRYVDLLCVPDAQPGGMGAGVVHHVAFRTPDDAQQQAWHGLLVNQGFNVSPIMDRNYFHSIYFREPGGVLFEIATDAPGFAIDENPETLGAELKLPSQYEHIRSAIERRLPPLRLP